MQLEKRMYFFVPYNISPIQQAIQAGHAALEYAHKFKDDPEYIDFVENHKTWIILNGGTTSTVKLSDYSGVDEPYLGSLDNLAHQLAQAGIKSSKFHEPDLNTALTAVCFIADERVFNYKDYPEFDEWFCVQEYPDDTEQWTYSYMAMDPGTRSVKFPTQYKVWVDFMGGEENVFLRELLKGKKLA